MTYEETRAILNVLFIAYPASYKGWKPDQYKYLTALYTETFKNVPAGVVAQAIKKELAYNRTNFAPSIGEVMYQVKNIVSVLDVNSAWEDVCYIVRVVDTENIPAAVRKLDEITRSIVTSRDIQRMKESSAALETYRPMFFSRYNKAKENKEDKAIESGNLLSISSRERLLELSKNPIELQIEANTEKSESESEDKEKSE